MESFYRSLVHVSVSDPCRMYCPETEESQKHVVDDLGRSRTICSQSTCKGSLVIRRRLLPDPFAWVVAIKDFSCVAHFWSTASSAGFSRLWKDA